MTENRPNPNSNPRNIRPAPAQAKAAKPTQEQAEAEMLRTVGSVIVRNEFYRDGYRSLLRIAVIEAMMDALDINMGIVLMGKCGLIPVSGSLAIGINLEDACDVGMVNPAQVQTLA